MRAPIVLFAYDRLYHAQQTIDALLGNDQVAGHDLIVFSDGARTPEKNIEVDQVRAYLATVVGFNSVTIFHRPHNFGLAKNIIEGVTQVLAKYDRVIVLEDDIVTSPYFLEYMNEALERYADDDRVASIHGYLYPVERSLPDAFFLPGADCWGWATWRRGWALFNPDGQFLLDELHKRSLVKSFDFNGSFGFSKILEGQVKGLNDSWAVRWYASAFLAEKLTLYPGRSLVRNIGNDGSGTHCGDSTTTDIVISATPIDLGTVKVEPSVEGRLAVEKYFKKTRLPVMKRIELGIKNLLLKSLR
jgi:glycosyltransferase involved in cell wall biosynthesis